MSWFKRVFESKNTVDKSFAESFFPQIGSVHSHVRDTALLQFQEFDEQKTSQVISIIQRNLKNTDKDVRASATRALRVLGPQALDSLLVLLHDSEWVVRVNAVHVLGDLQDKRAVKPLIELLANETSQNLRMSTIEALGQIKDDAAIDILVELLSDSDPIIAEYAVKALGNIGGENAINELINVIKQTWSKGFLTLYAAQALGLMGAKRAIDPLFELLQLKNDYSYGGTEGDDLEVETQRYNIAAAVALIKLGDERVFDILIEKLQFLTNNYQNINPYPEKVKGSRGYVHSKANRFLRAQIIGALGEIGNKKAIDIVTKFLEDEDEKVQMKATEVLAKLDSGK